LGDAYQRLDPIAWLTSLQLNCGGLAVDGFFIISGYLIPLSRANSADAGKFFAKRALRIYPAYIAVTLLMMVLVHDRPDWDTIWRLLDVQSIPIEVPAFNDNHTDVWNGSLWTIRYEMCCYLGVMLLWGMGAFRRWWVVAAGFLIFTVRYLAFAEGPLQPDRLIAFFAAGSLFYVLRRDNLIRYNIWAFLACIAGIAVGSAVKHIDIALPFLLPYVIFYLGFACRRMPWMRRYDLSYGIYITAYPITQALLALQKGQIGPYPLFFEVIALSSMAAVVSWLLIEQPALSFKRFFK
jgi:peptidoglycan/LPS O-acetylase OafA/YrhL